MVWEYLEEQIMKHVNANVIDAESGNKFSYMQLLERVNEVYSLWTNRIPARTKCAVICKNKVNEAIIILSCLKAEIIPVIMSENYGEEHCEKIVNGIEPNIALVDSDDLKKYFGCPAVNIFDREQVPLLKNAEKDLSDVALIMCTSGTTGEPKGVLITEKGLQCNINAILEYFKIEPGYRILISRPLYHCAVLTGEFFVSLVKGLDIVFYSGKYNPFYIKKCIKEMKIDVLCGTPTLFAQLSMLYRKNEVDTNLKIIALSGECLSVEVAKKIRGSFPEADIYNVYGLTENSPRVSFLLPSLFDTIPESVGKPLMHTIIKIVDDNGNEVNENVSGQIIVKSESVMKGYYRNTIETERKIINGYLQTGDIGYKDNAGNLFIQSRADDMIIKGGMNIYPKEIENCLLKIPYIEECVAYGEKKNNTEQICLDIVVKENINEREIVKEMSHIMPEYMMPDKVNIVNELARNASGKVIRKKVVNNSGNILGE